MDKLQLQQGLTWLKWHVKTKKERYYESEQLKDEDYVLMMWPTPPQTIQTYISILINKADHAKIVLNKFEYFSKLTTTSTSTDREREEALAAALEEMSYLIERFPEMSSEHEEPEMELY